ncbi:MAG: flagellar motor protein MotB [Planctomycetaceae bacterium]|nr:flagellar motor protein MotB [Planctomycetaceae bacterium]
MRRRKKPSGPNNGYLISFGDTMTALLAFFIVLNSLASEQTGANIYSGTGSFIRATDSLGVPGIFPAGKSRYSLQLNSPSPLYLSESKDPENVQQLGPDPEDDSIYVRDRELEDFERVLHELERLHKFTQERSVEGEVSIDRLSPLPKDGRLDEEFRKLLVQTVSAFQQPSAHVELIIWTPVPSSAAWKRASVQAHQLRIASQEFLKLTPNEAGRFTASARQWSDPKLKRPTATLVIRERTR